MSFKRDFEDREHYEKASSCPLPRPEPLDHSASRRQRTENPTFLLNEFTKKSSLA